MLRLFPLLLALLAQPAAAEPMEVVRTQHAVAQARLGELVAEQARLRASHEVLARRIAELKASDRAMLPGFTDGALDALLKEAHDLASRLEAQDRRVAAAQEAELGARATLLAAVDEALAAESATLARPEGDRQAAFERMKALVAERGRLQAALATEPRRTIELPAVEPDASPDELRALADEATDNAERVQSQLTALEARLQALQTRRRVLRAAVAFERDAALFAEDERNRRLVRADQPAVGVAVARPTGRPDAPAEAVAGGGGGGAQANGDQAPAPPPAAGAGEGAEFDAPGRDADDADSDGLADPGVAPEPLPTGVVAPGPVGIEGGGTVRIETALDPALLADDVEALSPAAVAEQIRAVERRRAALKQTASELEKRRADLEERARAAESN